MVWEIEMKNSFDDRCLALARLFLDDANLHDTEGDDLAQLIQEVIEDYIEDVKEGR